MIRIFITDEMKLKSKDFAIKKQATSYPRLGESKEIQLQRLFIGKLGEIIGQEALEKLNIHHYCPDKFKVIEDETYRDEADCIIFPNTENQLQCDFKTAWRRFHKKILIPQDQYFKQQKDIYIGIKLYCMDKNPSSFPNLKDIASVHGWINRDDLHAPNESSSRYYPAYWAWLNELKPLKTLLSSSLVF